MRFCGHVPNSLRNKNLKRLILNLLERVVSFYPKKLLSPFGKGKKNFFFNFECYDLANIRNESVKFGRHVDIKVNYKILQLEVPKLVPILHYLACFQ
jgi:hypothetical protein